MTHHKKISSYLLLSAAFAGAAFAQQVESVTVTAQRHAENIQDVPMSVATLDTSHVEAIFQSGQDIKALANHLPNVYAESSNGRVAPRFYIRGLGNTDFDLAASQPVSIIMDDIVMENVILKSSPIYDVGGVEVSRGPQGTLFGRNTTAGIIKFTTVKPTQEYNSTFSASYGQYNTASIEAAAGGGLTDTLSARISGLWQHRDNYINNAYLKIDDAMGGYDEKAARLQLLWKPVDRLSVLWNGHFRSLDGTAAIFRANIMGPGSNKLNSNYEHRTVWFDAGANNPQKYNGIGTSAEISYDFGPVVLTSITGYEYTHGYSRGDIDGGNLTGPGVIFFPSESQDGLDYLHQYTQEIHLASNTGGAWFWQVGGFWFDTDFQDTTYPFFMGPTSVRQTNISYALFGQSSYQFTDKLKVTAGLRWTADTKGLTAYGAGLATPITDPVRLGGSNLSWDLSADYAFTDTVKAYARISTGFRAPSIQGRDMAFGNTYSTALSETITSYEAGIKTELFDKSLRLNLDGFTYYVRNMQFSAIGGDSNSVKLRNARAGLAYGLEADAEWAATENLLFTAGAAWTHTEIRDPNLKTTVCAQCTVTNPMAGGQASLNGNPFPQAPDYSLSLTARYGYPLSNGGEIFAYTDWWLQGYTNFFLYKSKEFHSNGNYEGGLKVGYIFPDKRFQVAAYARNLTNKPNLQGGIDFDDNTGFVSDPRVIGLEISAHIE